ncbi:MAG: sigma-54 dependent transcriptional regulator [Acidobacteriota bacterium]|nr:sigma-54 dependent transcriptional regulator [Blastocatellia bacterium]MDW8239209.1 sigma-54 dependent transcriptional regulator [Acidobacteriota bacterium]
MATDPIRILVVDDDAAIREVLQMRLQAWGFDACVAADGLQARLLVESYDPDIIISDVVMPHLSGLELLHCLKAGRPRSVILITAYANVELAVQAMKQGAQDFMTKPLDYAKLKVILDNARNQIEQRRRMRNVISRPTTRARFGEFLGVSRVMREVYDLIEVAAGSDAPVLITGESGTGKALVARTIHDLSRRAQEPFISLNISGIADHLMESEIFGHESGALTGAATARAGCFELADGGTLLLAEITQLPLALQSKLLRVLEERCIRRLGGHCDRVVDVRVIATTSQDPRAAVNIGRLREDLYYSLNVFTITLPPLRGRHEDILLLAQHFISEFNHRYGLSIDTLEDEALQILKDYSWPGNVRELKNAIERAVLLAKTGHIKSVHLPPYIQDRRSHVRGMPGLSTELIAAEARKQVIV